MTRVLAYTRRPAPICDHCGQPIDGDPCEPHDPYCLVPEWGGDCDCDNQVCVDCCWDCGQVTT